MCGICGIIDPAGVHRETLQAMSETLRHRGPDDEGLEISGVVGLACRRLSIVDIEGGHMPMANEDGSVQVVFNGEIYNYHALREQLLARGHAFRSTSDTEVIVHLYEEEGPAFVERLDGMFAIALWDAAERRLVLVRDRLGQKPLFYRERGASFAFASEVKALLAVDESPREIDPVALRDYLSLRFVSPPRTMHRGICKLPAAHMLVRQEGRNTIRRYWDLDFGEKRDSGDDDWLNELRERLRKTVESHLMGDVPVGSLLSGGLDSSTIVAIMSKDLGLKPSTFAIGVEEQSLDELPFAREVAQCCATRHVERRVSSDLIRELPRMIWHLDEPSDPIAACQYHAARLASESVKVALGGDGGDELFGGFDRYWGIQRVERYRLIPGSLRSAFVPFVTGLADSFAYKGLSQKLSWLERLAAAETPSRRYAEATCFFRFSPNELRELIPAGSPLSGVDYDPVTMLASVYEGAPANTPLDRMLYTDIVTRLPEHSLMLTDRMSMANSLELRAPFLDHRLMEFMAAAPPGLKIRGSRTKHLLRRLALEYLPKSIVERDKQGFMFPVAEWFAGPLHGFVRDRLMGSRFVGEGWIQKAMVLRLLDEHGARRADHHVRLWQLLNLDIWGRIFLDGSPVELVEAEIAEAL